MPEFDLIRRYFTRPPSASSGALLGVGDDAALLRPRAGRVLAASTDTLVEGVHFFAGAEAQALGHKALAVNLSDMAAMGAVPRWALLALTLPRARSRWLESFSRGFLALARRHGVTLVGGDTTRGPLSITVQILGEVPPGAALRRDGARRGDDIWVSGELGGAALGLAAAQGRLRLKPADARRCALRLNAPQPRLALGLALRGVASAAIDVSDGLLADLGHILERSRVAAHIEYADVPGDAALARAAPARARGALLAGGDDYELCFTARRGARARVLAAARRARTRVTRIGSIEARSRGWPDCVVFDADGAPLPQIPRGYDHFRRV